MKLYDLKETTSKTGISRATIYRFYEEHPELWEETKVKIKKRLIPEAHLNIMAKNNIYVDSIEMKKQLEQQKRLIDLLSDCTNLQYRLYQMKWDWFGTIAFKLERSKSYCYHEMSQTFNHLLELYGKEIDLRIFFTVEPFTDRKGYHIHFVLRVGNGLLRKSVTKDIEEFYEGNRVEFKEYDKYKAGLFYVAKNGLKGEDWDINGNNLPLA